MRIGRAAPMRGDGSGRTPLRHVRMAPVWRVRQTPWSIEIGHSMPKAGPRQRGQQRHRWPRRGKRVRACPVRCGIMGLCRLSSMAPTAVRASSEGPKWIRWCGPLRPVPDNRVQAIGGARISCSTCTCSCLVMCGSTAGQVSSWAMSGIRAGAFGCGLRPG